MLSYGRALGLARRLPLTFSMQTRYDARKGSSMVPWTFLMMIHRAAILQM